MTRIFIFLNDSWSSVAGGVQTVNRELCLALARIAGEAGSDHRVICICVDPTLEEIRVAREQEVELVSADMVSTDDDPRVLTMLFRRELSQLKEVVGVFGHSKFTGLAAAAVKDAFFPTAKLVVIYHMDPDEVETAKGKWANAEERTRLEIEAVCAADFALAVGPRLETVLKSSLSGMIGKKPIVFPLLCGMRDDVLPREACPERPTFLFVGRTDQLDVKGLDLFADAAGRLVKYWYEELRDQSLSEPKFVIRGLPDNKTNANLIFEQLKRRAEGLAGRHVQLVGHTYTTDECSLRTDITNASALVMPSRAEGFGLVALEALSYGVPPIVAHDSGIGEFLRARAERAEPGVTELVYVVDTRAIGPNATDPLLKSLKYFTNRPAHSKILGENLRLKLLDACSWTAAARSVLVLFPSEPSQVAASALRIQASLRELLARERMYVENECRRISGCGPQDLLANRSVERINRESRTSKVVVNKGLDVLVKSDLPAIVLGEPGAGKTTALLSEVGHRCTVDLAALQSEPVDLDALEPSFYFHANDLAHVAPPNGGFLGEACLEVLSARHGALSDETVHWLRAAFIRERVLVAVDALDEVPGGIEDENTYFSSLVQLINGSTRLQPQVKLLLTSRSSTYVEGSLQGVPEWHLKPFTRQEMLTAAQGWLKNERAAEQLMASVAAAPPLGELVANPMLLMLACTVLASALKDGETLPSVFRRTDLYNGFVDWLTHRWLEREASKGDQPMLASRHQLAILMEEVAWSLWKVDARRSTFTNAELAEAVERADIHNDLVQNHVKADLRDSGLLVKAAVAEDGSLYTFLHRTLLEFLVAKYLARMPDLAGQHRDALFAAIDAHQVVWMLAGIVREPRILIDDILRWAHSQLDEPREGHSRAESSTISDLLSDCLLECEPGSVNATSLKSTWAFIARGLDRTQQTRRRDGGEWSGVVNWPTVSRALRAVERHEGAASQALHTLEAIGRVRGSILKKRGVLDDDAVTSAERQFAKAAQSDCALVRWAAVWLAMSMVTRGGADRDGSVSSFVEKFLRSDPTPDVRRIAARAIGDLRGPKALEMLTSAFRDPDQFVAAGAAIGLGRLMSKDSVNVLKRAAQDHLRHEQAQRDGVFVAVIGSLEWAVDNAVTDQADWLLGDTELAELMMRAMGHTLPLVRGTAASALGKLRCTRAWPLLRDASGESSDGDDTQRMRASIFFACDLLVTDLHSSLLSEAENVLISQLPVRNEIPQVRRPAASGLVRLMQRGYRSPRLTNALLLAVYDVDQEVARSAFVALTYLDPEDILDDLMLVLENFTSSHIQQVCNSLGNLPSRSGIRLINWILDVSTDQDVVSTALSSESNLLGRARTSMQLAFATELLSVESVDRAAVRALRLLGSPAAHVRASSLVVISQLARVPVLSPRGRLSRRRAEILRRVRESLNDANSGVSASACSALSAVGTPEDIPVLLDLMNGTEPSKVRKAAQASLSFLKSRFAGVS